MRAVWPDVIVGEGSLTQAIADVRRALGDSEHRLVRNVARRGYLLLADPAQAAMADAPALSIAVMPLTIEGDDRGERMARRRLARRSRDRDGTVVWRRRHRARHRRDLQGSARRPAPGGARAARAPSRARQLAPRGRADPAESRAGRRRGRAADLGRVVRGRAGPAAAGVGRARRPDRAGAAAAAGPLARWRAAPRCQLWRSAPTTWRCGPRRAGFGAFTPRTSSRRWSLLERAVALDPDSVRGWGGLTFINLHGVLNDWLPDRAAALRRIDEAAAQLERLESEGHYLYQARVIQSFLRRDWAAMIRIDTQLDRLLGPSGGVRFARPGAAPDRRVRPGRRRPASKRCDSARATRCAPTGNIGSPPRTSSRSTTSSLTNGHRPLPTASPGCRGRRSMRRRCSGSGRTPPRAGSGASTSTDTRHSGRSRSRAACPPAAIRRSTQGSSG